MISKSLFHIHVGKQTCYAAVRRMSTDLIKRHPWKQPIVLCDFISPVFTVVIYLLYLLLDDQLVLSFLVRNKTICKICTIIIFVSHYILLFVSVCVLFLFVLILLYLFLLLVFICPYSLWPCLKFCSIVAGLSRNKIVNKL